MPKVARKLPKIQKWPPKIQKLSPKFLLKKKKKKLNIEVFYEIDDFFVLDMCLKPIFCSKFARGC